MVHLRDNFVRYKEHIFPHVYRVDPLVKPNRDHVVNMSSNELLHPGLASTFGQYLQEIEWGNVRNYPTYGTAREVIANVCGLRDAEFLIAAGSDDAIRLLVEGICTKGAKVVLQLPNYEGWLRHASTKNIDVIRYLPAAAAKFDLASLMDLIDLHRGAVVCISNPNGPVGSFFVEDDIEVLRRHCEHAGSILVVDECYVAFTANFIPWPEARPHLIRVRSLSKSFGLAGARVAIVSADAEIIDYLTRFRPEYNISNISLMLATRAIADNDKFARYRRDVMESKNLVGDFLLDKHPEWQLIPSHANFLNIRVSGSVQPREIVGAMYQLGYRLKDTSGEPGLDRCFRISLAHHSIMRGALQVLGALDLQ